MAAERGRVKSLNFLVEKGADINSQDNDGVIMSYQCWQIRVSTSNQAQCSIYLSWFFKNKSLLALKHQCDFHLQLHEEEYHFKLIIKSIVKLHSTCYCVTLCNVKVNKFRITLAFLLICWFLSISGPPCMLQLTIVVTTQWNASSTKELTSASKIGRG